MSDKLKIQIKQMKKGDKVKLTKLSDDTFKGNHPNQIYEGHVEIGHIENLPTIGERFHVGPTFSTSVVTEALNKQNIFKTMYSTYKLEKL